jgi:hypothetical protein
VFLGDQLPAWLLLAFGGALAVGTLLALVRPPRQTDEGDLERPPLARSVVMITVGSLCAVWALVSLLKA